MTPGDRRLTRHLALAVLAKLAILVALWLAFFHHPDDPARTRAPAADTAAHVLGVPALQGDTP